MYPLNNFQLGGRQNADANTIMLFQADINYTQIYFSNGRKMTVATPLKELEKRFSNCTDFFRTHKSFMVNLNYVKEFRQTDRKSCVQMQNGIRAEISRRKRSAFKAKFLNITHL